MAIRENDRKKRYLLGKMMEKNNGNFIYNDMSADELADYFSRILNSREMKDIITGAPSLAKAERRYMEAMKTALGYVSATGDLSAEKQKELLRDFAQYGDEAMIPYNERTKTSGSDRYFADRVVPKILGCQAAKNAVKGGEGIETLMTTLEAVYAQGQNMPFLTHAFNGALLDEVKSGGLDISREKFVSEYAVLQQCGMGTPFQKGVLYMAEISPEGFGYAKSSPERLHMVVGRPLGKRGDDETRREYLYRGLEENLAQRNNLSEEEKQKARAAGQRITDFYTTKKGRQSVIAFVKNEDMPKTAVDSRAVRNSFVLSFTLETSRSSGKFARDGELKEMLADISACRGDANAGVEKIGRFAARFKEKYPDDRWIDDVMKNTCAKVIGQTCLQHFTHCGNVDGYPAAGGKIAADKLALCVFDNPGDAYAMERKTERRLQNMMENMYKRKCYDKKYAGELLRGREPAEDFPAFCQHNPYLTKAFGTDDAGVVKVVENPGFAAWKKLKGYDRKDSPVYSRLKSRAYESAAAQADASFAAKRENGRGGR